jgi:hypothetical protein
MKWHPRPQWTRGQVFQTPDGTKHPHLPQCPDCLNYHGITSTSCTGIRRHRNKHTVTPQRCLSKLIGQCERMDHHLGQHETIQEGHLITWEPYDGPPKFRTISLPGWNA